MASGERVIKEERKAAKKTIRQREKLEHLAEDYEDRGNAKKLGYAAISIAWIIVLIGNSLPLIPVIIVSLPFAVVSWLKGRWVLAILGVILTPLAVIGSVRLAKPFSWWFDRFYVPQDAATADHFLSKNSGSSARRSLTRNFGALDDADAETVINLYMLDRPMDYCISELTLGRGNPDVALPQHYKELFAFMNIALDHISDSARPETFREYFLLLTDGEFDIFVEEEFVEAAQLGAGSSTGGDVNEQATTQERDWFNEIPELLDVDREELDALPEDDPTWQAVTVLRLTIAADLEDGMTWDQVEAQLKWGEVKDLPFSERYIRARENYDASK